MIILHLAPINMMITNGFRFSVPGLISAQNNIDSIRAGLLNVGDPNNLNLNEVDRYEFEFMQYQIDISRLPAPFNNPDIVIFHGVYLPKYIKFYKQLVNNNIPYVIVPRVSLTNGAQNQKILKKKIGNLMFFNRFIKKSVAIHYLTESEMKHSIGFKKNFFVVGNGINIPDKLTAQTNTNFIITYMGRYDINHKGLDILVEAVNIIKEDLRQRQVTINLYGSNFRNGLNFLNKKVSDYRIEDIFILNDPVFNSEKEIVLQNTNIFIATSRFEGHPMAILEAMAYGIPCIATEGTNMLDEIISYNAGWEAKLDAKHISETVLLAIHDKRIIRRKGKLARKMIEDNYTWDRVAFETVKQYEQLI